MMALKRWLTPQARCVFLAGLLLISLLSPGWLSAKTQEAVVSQAVAGGRVYRLYRLKNRTADHNTPDAIVHVRDGVRAHRKFVLLVFNHGLTTNVQKEYAMWQMAEAMKHAPANAVLFLPEWAVDPEAYSSNAGLFHRSGFFRNMLLEVMSRVPELRGKTIRDIESIAIMYYSGGFRAAATEIHWNGLEDKIVNVSLFDSLYVGDKFDWWLKKNIIALAGGRKQFHNFFFDTRSHSEAQLRRVRHLMSQSGVKKPSLLADLDAPLEVLDAPTIARHGIIFKLTSIKVPRLLVHQSVAHVYFPRAVQAINLRAGPETLAAVPQEPEGEFDEPL